MDPVLFVSDLIARLGYSGVAAAMFIEAIFPPIPSEIVLPFAGFAAAQGKLTIIGVLIAATLGSLLGSTALYFFGRLVSEKHLQKLVERWGKPIGIKRSDVMKARSWFDKHGYKAVFLGRMIPGVRTVISIPAGISHMPFLPFLLWSGVGTALWSALLIMAGFLLGNQYQQIATILAPFSKVLMLLAILGITWWLFQKFKMRHSN